MNTSYEEGLFAAVQRLSLAERVGDPRAQLLNGGSALPLARLQRLHLVGDAAGLFVVLGRHCQLLLRLQPRQPRVDGGRLLVQLGHTTLQRHLFLLVGLPAGDRYGTERAGQQN